VNIENPVAKVALLVLPVAVAAPALASIVLLWAGERWPGVGRSILDNAVGGVVLTLALGAALLVPLFFLIEPLGGYDTFYFAVPLIAAAVALLALLLQIRARASFSTARAVGIVCAIAVPFVLPSFLIK
jgi:hypothetical protein